MKVLAFTSNTSAPGYHRIILPLGLMVNTDVFVTNNITDEMFEGADVFMYNRILPDNAVDKLYDLQQKHGFKIVVDIDDYWNLDPHHVSYQYYNDIGFAVKQIKQMANADLVFVTHDRLADQVKPYNTNVHVLPNAIPKFDQFIKYRKNPAKDYRCRVFWQGSPTHLEDLALLKHVFRNLDNSDNIKMVIAGYTENDPVWEQMALLYTNNAKLLHTVIDAMPISNYYQAYTEADICLVPLINSMFNSMKSNLKVLEAANLGLPVIASNVHPYKEMPLVYPRTSRDWITWIKKFAASSKRREEYGAALKDFCDIHYNFKKINLERKQILEHETRK
jgi:glycosyltransferase involved in cell wall biosynthesis